MCCMHTNFMDSNKSDYRVCEWVGECVRMWVHILYIRVCVCVCVRWIITLFYYNFTDLFYTPKTASYLSIYLYIKGEMLGESTFSLLRASRHCASLPCVITGFSVIFIGAFHSAMLWWLCPSLPTETLKWLSSLPILMQGSFWWWQCSDR